jgi:hypothetical protein
MSHKLQKAKRYTFFSQGTGYTFNPDKNASFNGALSNLLKIHQEEVKFRNSKDCYILDEFGKVFPT